MNKPQLLGVNIDHVATLRQARHTDYPNIIEAASLALQGGADSITVHLREDRRHIQERDVFELRKTLDCPLNLELAVTDEMLVIAEQLKPAYCCFVPERRQELTTEGGLDVCTHRSKIREACDIMRSAGIRPALFIDAEARQIQAASDIGVEVVEIHTGQYAEADKGREQELARIAGAISQCRQLGIRIHAGHGLNYDNIRAIAALNDIREFNIGHAIVSRAVFTGMVVAVSEMKQLIMTAKQQTTRN